MIMAIPILLLAACNKEVTPDDANQANALSDNSAMDAKGRTTFPIFDKLESDPDPNPQTECGSAITYGTMTFLGKVHGISVNKTCIYNADYTELAVTSVDTTYGANGNQLWTEGDIVIHFPTDGSTVATITGGSKIVGGTGRYAGATGFFIYEDMVYDLVTGHESHVAHGKITFVR